jgi:hypothetical protein
MFIAEQHEPLLSFPRIPENGGGYATDDLALRPFGYYESDLNVDFHEPRRPFLVTELLECCTRTVRGERVRPEFFWQLTVGKRIECLLILATVGGDRHISSTFRCPNELCGEELEVEIAIDEVAATQREADASEPIEAPIANGRTIGLRRPTANDQREWLHTRFPDEASVVETMLRSLVVDGSQAAQVEHSSELIPMLESALDAHDPLVNFVVTVKCSACGSESLLPIDLEEFSLQRLREAQLRLLASVHLLAATYHWSEPQIFNVPYWRRARYLNLIEKEKSR